jgi:hypothetical protein
MTVLVCCLAVLLCALPLLVAAQIDTTAAVPFEPLPTEPLPTEPIPIEPLPTEPIPIEPLPTEPLPTEPLPTEPFPTEPFPTEPTPSVSTPIVPVPSADGTPAPNGVPMVNSTASPVGDHESQLMVFVIAGCIILGIVIVCIAGACFFVRHRRHVQQEHAVSPIAVVVAPSPGGTGGSSKRKGGKKKVTIPETALERRRREVGLFQPYGDAQPSPHSHYPASIPPMQPSHVFASGPYAGAEMSPQRPLQSPPPNSVGLSVYQHYSSGNFYHSPHAPGNAMVSSSTSPPPPPPPAAWPEAHVSSSSHNDMQHQYSLPHAAPSTTVAAANGGPYHYDHQDQRRPYLPASGRAFTSDSTSPSCSGQANSSPTIPLHPGTANQQQLSAHDQLVDYGYGDNRPPPSQPAASPYDEDDNESSIDDERASLSGAGHKSHSTSRGGDPPVLAQTANRHHF